MKTVEYLDAVKKKLGISSDYALQAPLGVKKQSVSNYRNGRSGFDSRVAMRVAQILGLEPLVVIADMEIERAATPEVEDFWKQIARKVALVSVITIVTGNGVLPSPAGAAPVTEVARVGCVLCQIARKALLLLTAAIAATLGLPINHRGVAL
jgi:hypothetical protein